MELIGKKVRGFKFENRKYNSLDYRSSMDFYIGKIGTISNYYEHSNTYMVMFENSKAWVYPAELIEEHLIEETITLPLINGVPDLSEFEGVKMLVSDDGEIWYKSRVLTCNSKEDWYATPYEVFKYAKPIPAKKKITADEIKKMFNCEDFEIV